jgi:two-component system, NtrC family, nitrogen regulation sensor histidine kinase NtrY
VSATAVSPGSHPSISLDAANGRRPRPPRRFRRRLLLVLIAAGLGPLVAAGLLGNQLLTGVLALAPPVDDLLARAAESAAGRAPAVDPRLAADLRLAQLRLAQADLARRRLTERLPLSFAAALVLSACIVALAAWLLGRRLSRPVETLVQAMGHFARGDLGHQAPVSRRGDELDYLAVELNRLGRQLVVQRERLAISESLAAWRDAARALAHDLGNPLTAMRMAIGRLARPDRTEAALAESLALLQEEVDVLIRMSGSFAEFARLPEPRRDSIDLGELTEEVGALYRTQHPTLRVVVEGRPQVVGDGDQLRRALGNLVKNALEAQAQVPAPDLTGAVELPVELRLAPAEDRALARLTVRDHGQGVGRVIEGGELVRGLRSSKAGGQRGLGLPIAHKVAHDHGGRLRLCPAEGGGTLALLDLPAGGWR